MFASKLIVSEDTKNIKLTDNQRGKLRWNKLKELNESGELPTFEKHANELAKMTLKEDIVKYLLQNFKLRGDKNE